MRGQQQFLQENGFRSLAALAKEVNAKFAKARASTESFLRLVHDSIHDPNLHSESLQAYLSLYLMSPSMVSDEQKWRACATKNPENPSHVPLAFTPRDNNQLMLSVSCFEGNINDTPKPESAIPLYTVDIRSWLADAFQEQTNEFDDVLVADQAGWVIFEQSTSGPRIADLDALMSESDYRFGSPVAKGEQKAATSSEHSSSNGEGSAAAVDHRRKRQRPATELAGEAGRCELCH